MSDDNPNVAYLTISPGDVHTIVVPPMFPAKISVGDISITLNHDGTWLGNRDEFFRALRDTKQDMTSTTMPLLWLVAHALRNSDA